MCSCFKIKSICHVLWFESKDFFNFIYNFFNSLLSAYERTENISDPKKNML